MSINDLGLLPLVKPLILIGHRVAGTAGGLGRSGRGVLVTSHGPITKRFSIYISIIYTHAMQVATPAVAMCSSKNAYIRHTSSRVSLRVKIARDKRNKYCTVLYSCHLHWTCVLLPRCARVATTVGPREIPMAIPFLGFWLDLTGVARGFTLVNLPAKLPFKPSPSQGQARPGQARPD